MMTSSRMATYVATRVGVAEMATAKPETTTVKRYSAQVTLIAMNGPDVCQERNTFGTIDGNCGLNTTINGISLAVDIIPCELTDKDCGKVICSNMSDTRGLPTYFIVTLDGGEECVTKVPLIFPGVFRDSTYVENNIGCEDNSKVCFEGRCVDFNSLCPNDCHGNGVCTSRGECFCNPGFSPPNCTSPGFGGSISSGPVPSTDPVCTHESPRDKFGITTEEVKVQVDCRYTCISVSFNICPFIQRGYNLSNLVLFGPALAYNPLQQQLPEVNNSCRIQLDPFVFGHDPRGRITLQFGGGNLMSGACGSVIINEPSSISFVHRLRTIGGVSLAGGGRVVRTQRNFVFDFTCNFSTEVQSVGGIAPSDNCAAPDPLGSECTNNITENCESQRARFSFAMFKWATSSRDMMDIYIHCESKVCDSSAQQCQCGNCSGSRKRRSSNDRSNLPIHDVISAGPFVVT